MALPGWHGPTRETSAAPTRRFAPPPPPHPHFLATSDIHLKHKLRIDREECVDQVIKAVSFARSLCDDVEFSPEDAGRSGPGFLVQVLGEAIKAGASTLNISPIPLGTRHRMSSADSSSIHQPYAGRRPGNLVGSLPQRSGPRYGQHTGRHQGRRTPGRSNVERHRRASGQHRLEEVVMALTTRPQSFNVQTNIDTSQDRTHQPHGHLYRHGDPAEQGYRGGQCLCPRGRDHQDGMLKTIRPTRSCDRRPGIEHVEAGAGKHSAATPFGFACARWAGDNMEDAEVTAAFKVSRRLPTKKW